MKIRCNPRWGGVHSENGGAGSHTVVNSDSEWCLKQFAFKSLWVNIFLNHIPLNKHKGLLTTIRINYVSDGN